MREWSRGREFKCEMHEVNQRTRLGERCSIHRPASNINVTLTITLIEMNTCCYYTLITLINSRYFINIIFLGSEFLNRCIDHDFKDFSSKIFSNVRFKINDKSC